MNNAVDCFLQVLNRTGTLNVLNMLGAVYGNMGWANISLQAYLEAIHLLEKSPDSVKMDVVLSNIAGI